MVSAAGPRRGAFISYARADGEAAARRLHARLVAEVPEVPAWLDRLEIEGGVGWWRQIETQLDRAEFLLIVMTPAALASPHTRQEWRAARQRGVCVYPVKGVPDAQLDYAALPRWMAAAHFYDPDREWPSLVAHLRRGCVVARVPFMAPALPVAYVPRPRELEAVVDLLLTPGHADPVAVSVALRGGGGFGKTTLAAAVCHDERVIDAFADGILWVTLGQTPQLLAELTKLYAAVTGERPGFVDVDDAVRELALRLERRSCLLVIDDAWSSSHVAPFHGAAAGCARLVTTRLLEVAIDARRVDIDRMDEPQALQMLAARGGIVPPAPPTLPMLAVRLGGWPLAIKLVGSVLRQRIAQGDEPERAVDRVGQALERRGPTAFDTGASASGARDTVARSVEAGLTLLKPDDRRRCAELAIFPEDEAVPLAVAATLWQLDEFDAEELARRLDNLALVDFDLQRGELQMHDVLRQTLMRQLPEPEALHARLVDAWGDPMRLAGHYPWRHCIWHLQQAGRAAALRALLLDACWLQARLRASHVHSLLRDFDGSFAATRVLRLVRDALRLAAPALASDPAQLGPQLAGRLLARDEPEIVTLRQAALALAADAQLVPLHATLDAPGGLLAMTLIGHRQEVTAVAFDARGERLLTASLDGTLRLWELQHGQPLAELGPHGLGARAAALRGEAALAGGGDGRLTLWSLMQSEPVRRFAAADRRAVRALAWAADGVFALSASRDHHLTAWDVLAGKVLFTLPGHDEAVNSVAIAEAAPWAASASDDGSVRLWNLATRQCERVLAGHAGPVNAVAIVDDGSRVLSGGTDGTLRLWRAGDGSCLRLWRGHHGAVTAVAFDSAATRVLSGGSDQQVRLWDAEHDAPLALLDGHSDAVTAVALAPDGHRAASASADRSVKLWQLDDLAAQSPAPGHGAPVVTLAFGAGGRLLGSSGAEGSIFVHDTASGAPVLRLEGQGVPVRALAFTPDGRSVLSADIGGQCRMWAIDDGAETWIPVRRDAPVKDCAISPDARFLAVAGSDHRVVLWDMPSGVLLAGYGTRRLFDPLIEPSSRRAGLLADDAWLDRYIGTETVYDVHRLRFGATGRHLVLSATVVHGGSLRTVIRAGARARDHTACLLLFDVDSGEILPLPLTPLQAEAVTAFALAADGRHLLWARTDGALEWCDLRGEAPPRLLPCPGAKVRALAVSADGRLAYSCSDDRTLRAWDLDRGSMLAAFTTDAPLCALALAPDGVTAAVGDVAGRVHWFRLDSR